LVALSDLAYNLTAQGRYDEAIALDEEILAGRIDRLGAEHAMVAVSPNNLAMALVGGARCAEAEAEGEEALRLSAHVEGEDSGSVPTAWNNLCYLRRCFGDYEGAAQALASARRIAGRHPEATAGFAHILDINLGVLEARLGRARRGETVMRR